MTEEIWKDVKGYEGLYKVSDLGNVKSLNYNKTKAEKLMTPFVSNGYLRIRLHNKGIYKTHMVHRLVCFSFLENSIKDQVNHINGIKSDNRLINLEWVTQSENELHSYKVLGKIPTYGINHGNSILNDIKVFEIRKSDLSDKHLSVIYKVSRRHINNIKNRKTWTHI